ncbi:HU family DNA-binding protein [Laspinema olomoucense]|nr:HU family DNA-binding protein [Laspinema sp. D3b]
MMRKKTKTGADMTKTAEIMSYITEQTGYAEAVSKSVMDAFVGFLALSLRQGENVTVKGLGTFSVKNVPARKSRNPRTGEAVDVPAKKRPGFKYSVTFKESIQEMAPLAEEEVPPPPVEEEIPPLPVEKGQPERVWHISEKGKAVKKTEGKIKSLTPSTMVYGNGYKTWTKASDVPELSYLVA